jgi:hypothetical protein
LKTGNVASHEAVEPAFMEELRKREEEKEDKLYEE